MPAVAALLDSRITLNALRRSLPPGAPPAVACRMAGGVDRTLNSRLVESLVVGPRIAKRFDLGAFGSRFPSIPIVVFGAVRSDDADQLLSWHRHHVAAVLVEGVDDPVAGDAVMRHSVSARRRAALADAPRILRLTEPIQQATWDRLVRINGRPPRALRLAREMGLSREHLSRQFGAGGAPNLKRVSDLLSVLSALTLLGNPGYALPQVARLLRFSTPSHLRTMVRRITGLGVREASRLAPGEVVGRFVRNGSRSRG